MDPQLPSQNKLSYLTCIFVSLARFLFYIKVANPINHNVSKHTLKICHVSHDFQWECKVIKTPIIQPRNIVLSIKSIRRFHKKKTRPAPQLNPQLIGESRPHLMRVQLGKRGCPKTLLWKIFLQSRYSYSHFDCFLTMCEVTHILPLITTTLKIINNIDFYTSSMSALMNNLNIHIAYSIFLIGEVLY